MLECGNNNTGARETKESDMEESDEDCKRPKVSLSRYCPPMSPSEVQVFPSSFSIAALIGAAAIRERVVTNLRLNSQQEEEEAGDTRDSQAEFKRKLSAELNPDDDQGSDLDYDIKKPKIEDESNSLVSQPKIVNMKENPIFDQIKLANCFLRDQSLIKAQRAWEREEDKNLSSPASLISSMSVSSPGNSTSAGDFSQKNSSSAGKQSVVNSNTKLLEKVSLVKTKRDGLSNLCKKGSISNWYLKFQ